MADLDYRNRLALGRVVKLALTPDPLHARGMDVARVKKACEQVRPALGIAPGLNGSFALKFENGRCTHAEQRRILPPINNAIVDELKAALGLPDDCFGDVEVRMEDGVPTLVKPGKSVRLK